MDTPEPNYEAAFQPSDYHHQGMSPNTAQTAVRGDHGGDAEVLRQQAGNGEMGHQQAVAVRAMAVAMATATGSPAREPAGAAVSQGDLQFPEGTDRHAFLQQGPDVEAHGMAAAWGSGSPAARRVLPIWMQRLGAFFQEMRASQQARGPPWMPSPFPTTPVSTAGRRMLGSPETDPGPRGIQPLFSRDQRAQARQMEMRAPLLYGPSVGQGRGEASSGGSTAEAVQEEVRKQLRGVMDELAESRREAGSLREELQRLRNQADRPQQALLEPEGLPRVFGGYLADASAATMPMSMPQVSGAAPMPPSMPQVSGAASMPLSMPQVSGAASMPMSMPQVSGAASMPLSMPQVSGSASMPLSMPQVSGSASMPLSMPQVSGSASMPSSMPQGSGVAPMSMPMTSEPNNGALQHGISGGVAGTTPAPTASATTMPGHNVSVTAGDPVMKLIQGLEAVLTKSSTKAQEEVTKSAVEAPKLAELSEASAIVFGDWIHCLENVMGDLSTNSGEWWRAVL